MKRKLITNHYSLITVSDGFTLVEVIIAAAISLMLLFVLGMFVYIFFQNSQLAFDKNLTVAEAEDGLRRMTRLVTEARPSENGSYPLEKTDDDELIFFSDYDNDQTAERIRFFKENTLLKRGIIEPTGSPPSYLNENEKITIISDHIRNTTPLFLYYNGSWPTNTTNNPLIPSNRLLETRLITVHIVIGTTIDSDTIELSTSAQLRNLKDNL